MLKSVFIAAAVLAGGIAFADSTSGSSSSSASTSTDSCNPMASAYRRILGAQAQVGDASKDKSGDLNIALSDTDPVLQDITEALSYANCTQPADTPAKVVSLVVGSSLVELEHCPHRFYAKRFIIDAINAMKNADPVFDGHRADAIKAAEALLAEINADLVAVNKCEPVSSSN